MAGQTAPLTTDPARIPPTKHAFMDGHWLAPSRPAATAGTDQRGAPPSRTRKRGCLTTRHRKCDRTTVGGGSSPSLASTRSSPIRPTRAGVHDHRIRCSRTNGLTVQDHRNPHIGRVARPRSVDRRSREGMSRYASTKPRYFDNALTRVGVARRSFRRHAPDREGSVRSS